MKNKKVMLVFLAIIFVFTTGFKSKKSKENDKKVLEVMKRLVPDDNFYFIEHMKLGKLESDISMGRKYSGILYSDKLKEAKALEGIYIVVENLTKDLEYRSKYFLGDYNRALNYQSRTSKERTLAKQTFGNSTIVYVSAMDPDIDIYKFVSDIEKLNEKEIEEYKKKLFDLYQVLKKEYLKNGYDVDFNVDLDILDKKYFSYKVIDKYIFSEFKNDKLLKILLKKLKRKENLTENEMGYVTEYIGEFPLGLNDFPRIAFFMVDRYKKYTDIKKYIYTEEGVKND